MKEYDWNAMLESEISETYESPITRIARQIMEQETKQEEEALLCSVKTAVGFDVNKEELLKALNYDRDQYRQGYRDACMRHPFRPTGWISVKDKLPEDEERVLICADVDNEEDRIAIAYRMLEEWSDDEYIWRAWETLGHSADYDDEEVIAWIPLPEPYEEGEEE